MAYVFTMLVQGARPGSFRTPAQFSRIRRPARRRRIWRLVARDRTRAAVEIEISQGEAISDLDALRCASTSQTHFRLGEVVDLGTGLLRL
jgi:hypothetical protein